MFRFTVCLALVAVALVQATPSKRATPDYPGRSVSADDQCNQKHYAGVCSQSDLSVRCQHLMCAGGSKVNDIPENVDVGPALDGTRCGDKKICINKVCSDDPNPPATQTISKEYGCNSFADFGLP